MFEASDARLVRRVLAGSREAFGPLVRRHSALAYALAYSRLGNHTDAEDVVQEAFAKAYGMLDSLREPAKFGAWLGTIVRNTANGVLRRRGKESEALERVAGVAEVAPVDTGREELRAVLRRQVMALEEIDRDVLLMHYYAGQSAREIGEVLGISRDAVKKRLERARKSLSTQLAAQVGELMAPQKEVAPDRERRIMGAVLAVAPGWVRRADSIVAEPSLADVVVGIGIGNKAMLGFLAAVLLVVLVARGIITPNSSEKGLEMEESATVVGGPDEVEERVTQRPNPAMGRDSHGVNGANVARASTTQAVAFPEESFTLFGRVLYEDGSPVEGASTTIVVQRASDDYGEFHAWSYEILGRSANQFRCTTDFNGRFVVAGLPPHYNIGVYVEHEGRIGVYRAFRSEEPNGDWTFDVTLDRQDKSRYVLGRVVDAFGVQVKDGLVCTWSDRIRDSAIDADGFFRTPYLDGKDLIVEICSDAGYALFEPSSLIEGGLNTIELPFFASLEGLVVSVEGLPVSEVWVKLQRKVPFSTNMEFDREAFLTLTARTDAEGRFDFAHVQPCSDFTLRVESSGGKLLCPEILLGDVLPGGRLTKQIRISELPRFRGQVISELTGEAVQFLAVSIADSEDGHVTIETGSEGRFDEAIALPEGIYTAFPNFEGVPDVISESRYGSRIRLSAGDTTDVTLSVDPPCAVPVLVVDTYGNPISGARVLTRWNESPNLMEGEFLGPTGRQTDIEGHCLITGVCPFGWTSIKVYANGFISAESEPFSCESSPIQEELAIVCNRSASISGIVTTDDGVPVRNTQLGILLSSMQGAISVTSDDTGRFECYSELPSGPTKLQFQANVNGTFVGSAEVFVDLSSNDTAELGAIVVRDIEIDDI